jgi:hypothetical protein
MIKKRTCNNCRWYLICIDPCDNCEIYNSIKFKLPSGEIVDSEHCDGEGEIVEDTLCPHEQHDKKCNKIAAITCEEFEYPLDGEDPEFEKIMKSLE